MLNWSRGAAFGRQPRQHGPKVDGIGLGRVLVEPPKLSLAQPNLLRGRHAHQVNYTNQAN